LVLEVSELNRGDQLTRYRELWSLRRVVFSSGVQYEFIKTGSRSSVGEGVKTAQIGDQAPIWVSRLGAAILNCGTRGCVTRRAAKPSGVAFLARFRRGNASLRPSCGLGVDIRPEKGRLKMPPRLNLKEGYAARLALVAQPRPKRLTGEPGSAKDGVVELSSLFATKAVSASRDRPVRTSLASSRPNPRALGAKRTRVAPNGGKDGWGCPKAKGRLGPTGPKLPVLSRTVFRESPKQRGRRGNDGS